MSGLFFNKVAAATLSAVLGVLVINRFAGIVVHPEVPEPDHFAYKLAAETEAKPVKAEPVAFPSPAWLSARDPQKGAKVFKKCKACHDVSNAKKDGTGPHLWGVVGRPKAAAEGFSYSSGMKSSGGNWTYEDLDKFLTKPKDFIKGTKMTFNGLKKETDRAAIIEFLRLQSDNPLPPLPAKAEAPAEVEQQAATPETGANPDAPDAGDGQ